MNLNSDQIYIYVLKLAEGKWYVGKTSDPVNRLVQHLEEKGSAWTKKYPLIQIHEVKPDASKYDEDKNTFEYMELYGWENVRGGSYVQVNLPEEQVREILRRQASANGACFTCLANDHTIANCPLAEEEEEEPAGCWRCGRENHEADKCYAKSHVDGGSPRQLKQPKKSKKSKNRRPPSPESSSDEVECLRCGRDNHDFKSCYARSHVDGGSPRELPKDLPIGKPKKSKKQAKSKSKKSKKEPSSESPKLVRSNSNQQRFGRCFRCGRFGHWGSECFAHTNVDGQRI